MTRWRKALVVIAFIGVAAAIGVAIYFVFFRGIVAPGPAPEEPVPTTGLLPPANEAVPGLPAANVAAPGAAGAGQPAEIAGGGLTLAQTLVPTVVNDPQLSSDGSSMYYYDRVLGQYLKLDPATGSATPLSAKLFPGVDKTDWSPIGETKAILEYPDGHKIFYDFAKDEQVTLPSHWQEFEWSPNGTEIAAKSLGVSENNRFLILANPDGSNARPIAPLGANADKVDIAYSPSNDIVAFSKTGNAQPLGTEQILPVGKNQENIRGLDVQGIGFKGAWAPDGARLLYSAAGASDDWKPSLWVVDGRSDAIGNNRKAIGLKTWADKCGFASATVAYCAAPRELPTGAGFSRSIANDTQDDIYRVDLKSGQYRLVATPSDSGAISQIMISKDGGMLYFTELQSGALKKIKLR